MRSSVFFLFISTITCGCSGPVIQTVGPKSDIQERFDGTFMNYFFARGEVTVTATYSKATDQLTISLPADIQTYPDLAKKHTLAYSHGILSDDEVNIELDRGMLKKVSSTTSDQTVQLVKNVNELLGQIASTQAALEKAKTRAGGEEKRATCDNDIKANLTVDLTYGKISKQKDEKIAEDCKIKLEIVRPESPPAVKPKSLLGVAGYPKDFSDDGVKEEICDQAVCFRLAGAYFFGVKATLTDNDGVGKKGFSPISADASYIAPVDNRLGFVRFDRRRFVTNTTTLEFTNGTVSKFSAKDPSEVVGFITLPTVLLKSVVLAVQF